MALPDVGYQWNVDFAIFLGQLAAVRDYRSKSLWEESEGTNQ